MWLLQHGVVLAVCAGLVARPVVAAATPRTIPRVADVAVAGILVNDPASAVRVLGHSIPLSEGPQYSAHFMSGDGSEELTVFFHPGNRENAFSEFRVAAARSSDGVHRLPKVRRFITGKGVRLGISEGELKAIFGEPRAIGKSGTSRVLTYSIRNIRSSPFLQHYGMPDYESRYTFLAGKLVEFSFGFPYP